MKDIKGAAQMGEDTILVNYKTSIDLLVVQLFIAAESKEKIH